jgi:phage repressor protein C with HTH and peptisase S24 domain
MFARQRHGCVVENAAMDIDWIRKGLAKPGKTQAGLAGALGIHPSGVTRLLAGERQLKAAEIARAAAYLELDPAPEIFPAAANATPPRAPSAPAPLPLAYSQDAGSRDLPVLGNAMGGPDGYFEMQGLVIEHVWRPPFLATVRNAFALYVIGSSMAPRYEEGELIYCHPGRRPKPGDYVVVELGPEPGSDLIGATIGRFKRQTGSHVELEKLNPAAVLRIAAAKVSRIHIVVGTGQP